MCSKALIQFRSPSHNHKCKKKKNLQKLYKSSFDCVVVIDSGTLSVIRPYLLLGNNFLLYICHSATAEWFSIFFVATVIIHKRMWVYMCYLYNIYAGKSHFPTHSVFIIFLFIVPWCAQLRRGASCERMICKYI